MKYIYITKIEKIVNFSRIFSKKFAYNYMLAVV